MARPTTIPNGGLGPPNAMRTASSCVRPAASAATGFAPADERPADRRQPPGGDGRSSLPLLAERQSGDRQSLASSCDHGRRYDLALRRGTPASDETSRYSAPQGQGRTEPGLRGAGVKLAFLAIAIAVAFAFACGGVPGVETPHQSYWYGWNRESLHVPDTAHPRSVDPLLQKDEHLLSDPELKAKG